MNDNKPRTVPGKRPQSRSFEEPPLLEKIFNSVHVHIAYLDRDFNFIRVNEAYAKADGRDPAFFVGKNHFDLYPSAENEVIFRKVVMTGQPYFVYERPFEYEAHPERGRTYWDWSLEPVRGDDGKVEGLLLSLIDVTKRKRSEVNLEEAQRLAHIGSWEWDLLSGQVHWSDEIYRIYGCVPHAFTPTFETAFEAAHPDDRARVKAYFDRLPDGGPRSIEHRVVRPDGGVRIVRREADVLRDKHGRALCLLGTCQDITEVKSAEDALRRREQEFRTMVEAWPDVIARLDKMKRHLYISPAVEQVTGIPPAIFIGKSDREVGYAPEEILRLWEQTIDRVLASQKAETVQFSFPGRNGARHYEWRVIPEFGADGQVHTVLTWARDITDRRRHEEELRHTQSNLAEAQRLAHLGNWEWDIMRDTLWWSDEIYRIFGLAPQQFGATYEAFLEAIHPDDRHKVVAAVQAALQKETRRYAIDHRIVVPDGSIRYVHEEGEVTFERSGRPARMIGTVQDITERKLGEIAMRKLNRALRTLSHGNQALVRAATEDELLRTMCRVLVEEGGYRAVWVGYARSHGAKRLRAVAQIGFSPEVLARLSVASSPAASHPAVTAIRTGHPQMVRDAEADPGFAAWSFETRASDAKSLVSLPLKADHDILGAITIHAGERNAFDDEEVSLLTEMANDLGYGIASLRAREDRKKAVVQLQKSMEATIEAVASTVEMRDPYTAGHQRRVAQLAAAIARELRLPEGEVTAVRMAGTVHDIGKIYVPAEILNRPGPLSGAEMTLVKTHAQVGYEILKRVDFPWPLDEMLRQHHERLDGSGYPRGLKGEEILPGARIIAVADVVEAMASHRPYRAALGLQVGLAEIERQRGVKYDAAAVDACLSLFREERFAFTAATD